MCFNHPCCKSASQSAASVLIDENKAGELCQKAALVHICVTRLDLLIAAFVAQHIAVVTHCAVSSILLILCVCGCLCVCKYMHSVSNVCNANFEA